MLEVAMEKAEEEGVQLVLLQQDIAELDFDVPNLDCILCACDGFNYLTYDRFCIYIRRAYGRCRL